MVVGDRDDSIRVDACVSLSLLDLKNIQVLIY